MKRAIWIVAISILLVGCSRWAYKVPTVAMEPTIKPGDTVWVDHGYYTSHPVERFDMVLYKKIVKRVIGLGGEKVEIREGRVFINDQELRQTFEWIPLKESFGPITIPREEYFLLGDNRANSFDSRYWNPPTLKSPGITGKVVEIKHN